MNNCWITAKIDAIVVFVSVLFNLGERAMVYYLSLPHQQDVIKQIQHIWRWLQSRIQKINSLHIRSLNIKKIIFNIRNAEGESQMTRPDSCMINVLFHKST